MEANMATTTDKYKMTVKEIKIVDSLKSDITIETENDWIRDIYVNGIKYTRVNQNNTSKD